MLALGDPLVVGGDQIVDWQDGRSQRSRFILKHPLQDPGMMLD
jgi:hypothetical protein